jgi:hypothetical protein
MKKEANAIMKKYLGALCICIAVFSLAGCASQGCYRYYSKDFVTESLNQIAINGDSTLSVILLGGFPTGGVYAYAKNISLGYYDKNEFKILSHDAYSSFHVNRRLYLFNLPPNTYYILSVAPDPCRIPKSSMPVTDASPNAATVDMNGSLVTEEELTIPFGEANYLQYPLKVEKDTFNLLGVYDIQRDFFSTEAELIFLKDMARSEEIAYFNNLVTENCKWRKQDEITP